MNGASAVPTTRALNLDVFSSRVAKAAELATRKMFETFRKFAVAMKKRMMSRFSEFIFFLNSNKLPVYKNLWETRENIQEMSARVQAFASGPHLSDISRIDR